MGRRRTGARAGGGGAAHVMASASAGRERRRRAGGARGQEPSRVVGYDADGAGKEEDGDAGFFCEGRHTGGADSAKGVNRTSFF